MDETDQTAADAGTGTWDQDSRAQHEQLVDEQARAEDTPAPTGFDPRDAELEQRADQEQETLGRDRETQGDPTLAQSADTPADVQGLTPDEYRQPDGPATNAEGTERREAFEDGRPVDGEGNRQ